MQTTGSLGTWLARRLRRDVCVTKTPVGSTPVVSEMAGLRLFPTTLVASIVALLLTGPIALINSLRDREGAYS